MPLSLLFLAVVVGVIATAIAQYQSTCDICGDPIYEGDIIAYDETAESFCHEECCEEPEGDR